MRTETRNQMFRRAAWSPDMLWVTTGSIRLLCLRKPWYQIIQCELEEANSSDGKKLQLFSQWFSGRNLWKYCVNYWGRWQWRVGIKDAKSTEHKKTMNHVTSALWETMFHEWGKYKDDQSEGQVLSKGVEMLLGMPIPHWSDKVRVLTLLLFQLPISIHSRSQQLWARCLSFCYYPMGDQP